MSEMNYPTRFVIEPKFLRRNKNESIQLLFKKLAFMLYAYIDEGLISYKEAADILKIPKEKLLNFYEEYGLPYTKYSQKEFYEDQKVFAFLDKRNEYEEDIID